MTLEKLELSEHEIEALERILSGLTQNPKVDWYTPPSLEDAYLLKEAIYQAESDASEPGYVERHEGRQDYSLYDEDIDSQTFDWETMVEAKRPRGYKEGVFGFTEGVDYASVCDGSSGRGIIQWFRHFLNDIHEALLFRVPPPYALAAIERITKRELQAFDASEPMPECERLERSDDIRFVRDYFQDIDSPVVRTRLGRQVFRIRVALERRFRSSKFVEAKGHRSGR